MRRAARALAACALLAVPAAAQDASLSYKYFYQDVFEPFFALDPASGRYLPRREGSHADSFEARKPDDVLRVFIVGGSIAGLFHGEEELEAYLERLRPGRRVEIINCGMSGYDSPREERVVREVLGYRPDAIILMSGHNESLALPWVPRWRLKTVEWAKKLGARPFQAAPALPAAARARAEQDRLAQLESRVRGLARACAAARVPLIVFLPPLNLHSPSATNFTSDPDFRRGWMRYLAGDCPGARRAWDAGRERGPAPLEAYFQARCLEGTGKAREADAGYERALSLEQPLLGRCGPACRAALARAAAEPGAFAADGDAEFRAYAAPRLPGYDLFTDAVHWRRALQPLTSRALAEALGRALGGSAGVRVPAAPARPAPPRDPGEWTALLRVAAAAIEQTKKSGESAVALAVLDYAARHGAGPLDGAALFRRVESDSEVLGRAWGMPPVRVDRAAWEWHLADALRAAGRGPEADAAFDAAVRAGGLTDALLAGRAAGERRAGRLDKAARIYALLRKHGWAPSEESGAPGGEPVLSYDAGTAKADPAGARKEAQDLEKRAARDPAARAGAAALYAWLDDRDAVKRVWCAPPAPALRCARACVDAGDAACGKERARRALASSQGPRERREAALVLQDAGEKDESLRILADVFRDSPKDADAARDYGVALFLSGRAAEAVAPLRRAAELEPEPGDGVLSLAAALDASGRPAEAKEALTSARGRAAGENAERIAAALAERR